MNSFLFKVIHPFYTIKQKIIRDVQKVVENPRFRREKYELEKLTRTSDSMGIQQSSLCEKPVIVTLTTHGKRLYDVHLAIESIMQGTVLPNKIILWISDEFEGSLKIPVYLQKLQKRGLEINYCHDIKSYTKLIHALKSYPDSLLITIDDDIIYPSDTLENLINAHLSFPDCICANNVRKYPDSPSSKMATIIHHWPCDQNRFLHPFYGFFEGFAGVLYPAKSLNEEVFNEPVFLDICKTGDDIWFNAMALLNGTKVVFSNPHIKLFDCIVNPEVQSVGLIHNNQKSLNSIMLQKVFSRYKLWETLSSLNSNLS